MELPSLLCICDKSLSTLLSYIRRSPREQIRIAGITPWSHHLLRVFSCTCKTWAASFIVNSFILVCTDSTINAPITDPLVFILAKYPLLSSLRSIIIWKITESNGPRVLSITFGLYGLENVPALLNLRLFGAKRYI